MNRIDTRRLYIFPLSYEQLLLYVNQDGLLESALGLSPVKRQISAELREVLELAVIPAVRERPDTMRFSTLWTIVHKEMNVMVGDLCFKGAPNRDGEVEVGYGTYQQFYNMGFMTEALEALADWAFRQPGVSSILAETEKANLASHKILLKNGFIQFKEEEPMLWWKKTGNEKPFASSVPEDAAEALT